MKRKTNYKLLIGAPLLGIIVAVITVLLLIRLAPQRQSTSSSANVSIASPVEIIKKYQTPNTIDGLLNNYTKTTDPLAGISIINYTASNSYTIYIPASDYVQVEQNNKTVPQNLASVKASSEKFLVKEGLQQKPMAKSSKTALFQVFDSEKTVCQLFDLPPIDNKGASLSLACVKKQIITDQYKTINILLALYKDSSPSIAHPTAIQLNTVTNDNKKLSIVNIYGINSASKAVSLIFAAINDKWQYIGQRNIAASDNAPVDTSFSDKLKTALSNPKYNGFLEKYVK